MTAAFLILSYSIIYNIIILFNSCFIFVESCIAHYNAVSSDFILKG